MQLTVDDADEPCGTNVRPWLELVPETPEEALALKLLVRPLAVRAIPMNRVGLDGLGIRLHAQGRPG